MTGRDASFSSVFAFRVVSVSEVEQDEFMDEVESLRCASELAELRRFLRVMGGSIFIGDGRLNRF